MKKSCVKDVWNINTLQQAGVSSMCVSRAFTVKQQEMQHALAAVIEAEEEHITKQWSFSFQLAESTNKMYEVQSTDSQLKAATVRELNSVTAPCRPQ